MPRYPRRTSRRLDELPSLFDDLPSADTVGRILRSQRSGQSSPERPLDRETLIARDRAATRLSRNPELEFISFGSGSSGNCAYIGVRGSGGVLIDAGVDADTVIAALKSNYIDTRSIAGILLTHDHSDHVRFAYRLLKAIPSMRLYCTPRIITGILRRHSISSRIKDYHTPIFKEFAFDAGPLNVIPFETSHDGTDNMGFCIKAGARTFVVATDTGVVTPRADHYIRSADLLMIEANYDPQMLRTGRYPEYLKARIFGPTGHLGNDVTAQYLSDIWQPALTDIFLCHLSQDNNTPELALSAVCGALSRRGISVGDASGSPESRGADVRVSVLPRFESSPLHIFRL